MAYPELYLNLNYNQKLILTITIVAIFILVQIIARIKNKQQKKKSKQVIYQKPKNTFSIDYDKFINANFENITYLYENKNRKVELIRMIG